MACAVCDEAWAEFVKVRDAALAEVLKVRGAHPEHDTQQFERQTASIGDAAQARAMNLDLFCQARYPFPGRIYRIQCTPYEYALLVQEEPLTRGLLETGVHRGADAFPGWSVVATAACADAFQAPHVRRDLAQTLASDLKGQAIDQWGRIFDAEAP